LTAARNTLETLRGEFVSARANADAFAPDCRITPEAAAERVARAKAGVIAAEAALREARRCADTLDGHRKRRAELGSQHLAADAEYHRWKTLAELLGRDRLQRHLVRTAERQIVDCANRALDRLGGGQLFLKLVGDGGDAAADRALDLECVNRATGGPPVGVQFLSGSQKFRVAVSLALGIGLFASRRHRPVETVIIDEGFGCLDREGRQTMIQELQNLTGFLKCVLLVSHQEEFAEAFPRGFRFHTEDRTTQVAPFG
jgi:DNA repair protein SbcC/Rad50